MKWNLVTIVVRHILSKYLWTKEYLWSLNVECWSSAFS